MKKNLFALVLLFAVAAIFEIIPEIKHGRAIIPDSAYAGKVCSCDCIRSLRPWYSTFNYWFWIWVLLVPAVSFSVMPQAPSWHRIGRSIFAIILCYVAMNMAFFLSEEIKFAPFVTQLDLPNQKTWEMESCFPYARIGARMFFPFLSVLYALAYVGLWEMLWAQYHKRKPRQENTVFKQDIFNKILVWLSVCLSVLIASYIFLYTTMN